MNRRGFLSTLLGTASAFALDPERQLWVPGTKTISIPKPLVDPTPLGLRFIRYFDPGQGKFLCRLDAIVHMKGGYRQYGVDFEFDERHIESDLKIAKQVISDQVKRPVRIIHA